MVRVRIAPSPTGVPHIGNTWAALINFVFSRKNGGKFILRLEDTDRERLIPESMEKIYETLKWLGLNYDEGPDIGGEYGPYLQSERLDTYQKYAQELLEKGLAYQEDGAIKFKTTKEGQTTWQDLVGNRLISFPNNTQEDFVLIKSDGYPTYNFANVIDDHLMEITHTIRGNEFISSTPKHLMLYTALGWTPPQFAHLPVLVGADRAKLSKRHGAKSALEFRDEGYLPEAIINFLALLGWSHPQQKDIFPLEELIKLFDLKDINQSSPYFDTTKLEWMNGEYIRRMSDSQLEKALGDYLVDHPGQGKLAPLMPLVKERIKKLSDFIPLTNFFFNKPDYDLSTFKRLKVDDIKSVLEKILEKMEGLKKPWTKEQFEKTFQELAQELGISNTDMFQLIRIGISGQLVTPPLFESTQILGEEEVILRVQDLTNKYPNLERTIQFEI